MHSTSSPSPPKPLPPLQLSTTANDLRLQTFTMEIAYTYTHFSRSFHSLCLFSPPPLRGHSCVRTQVVALVCISPFFDLTTAYYLLIIPSRPSSPSTFPFTSLLLVDPLFLCRFCRLGVFRHGVNTSGDKLNGFSFSSAAVQISEHLGRRWIIVEWRDRWGRGEVP